MAVDKIGKKLPDSVRLRKDGLYEGRIKYDYQSHSVYDHTLTGIKKKMTDLRYKLEHGEFIEKSKLIVDDWFKVWMQEYKQNQVKEGTIIAYNNYYDFYVKEVLGRRKLSLQYV